MRKITGFLAMFLSFQQAAFVAPAKAETTPPAPAPGATDTSARFLRAEASLWDTFGVKVSRNGKQLGPALFSILPDEAVAGSAEAARHVSHARVLQGFVLCFALTGVGLIAGSFALASNDNQWTQGSRLMLAGGLVAVFAEGLTALARQTEILAAVNAYNHDLVTGRLQY
jgi:hypothetical protein